VPHGEPLRQPGSMVVAASTPRLLVFISASRIPFYPLRPLPGA